MYDEDQVQYEEPVQQKLNADMNLSEYQTFNKDEIHNAQPVEFVG